MAKKIYVKRVRWEEGASAEEILQSAKEEETEEFKVLLKLLFSYHDFPEPSLRDECEVFLNREEVTPKESCEIFKKLCYLEEENIIASMVVGDSCFLKYKIYWLNPVQESSCVFEYGD